MDSTQPNYAHQVLLDILTALQEATKPSKAVNAIGRWPLIFTSILDLANPPIGQSDRHKILHICGILRGVQGLMADRKHSFPPFCFQFRLKACFTS